MELYKKPPYLFRMRVLPYMEVESLYMEIYEFVSILEMAQREILLITAPCTAVYGVNVLYTEIYGFVQSAPLWYCRICISNLQILQIFHALFANLNKKLR